MNDHISCTDSEIKNRDNHNEFHFEELFIIRIKLLLDTLYFQRAYIPSFMLIRALDIPMVTVFLIISSNIPRRNRLAALTQF